MCVGTHVQSLLKVGGTGIGGVQRLVLKAILTVYTSSHTEQRWRDKNGPGMRLVSW